MTLFKTHKRAAAAQGEAEPLPGWAVDWFLVGVLPPFGTAARRAFVEMRYKSPGAARELYLEHRASILLEAQALGFTAPDEPHGEMLFARDEEGMPLALPPGVKRIEEGSPAPWWASRATPEAQLALRQLLADRRAGAGASR